MEDKSDSDRDTSENHNTPTVGNEENDEGSTTSTAGRRRRRRRNAQTAAANQEQLIVVPKAPKQRKRKRGTQTDESGAETPSQPPAKRRAPRRKKAKLTESEAMAAENEPNTTSTSLEHNVTPSNIVTDDEQPTTSAAALARLQNKAYTPTNPAKLTQTNVHEALGGLAKPTQTNVHEALGTKKTSDAAIQAEPADVAQTEPNSAVASDFPQQQSNTTAEFATRQPTIAPLRPDTNLPSTTAGSTEPRNNSNIGNPTATSPSLANHRAENNQPPLSELNSDTAIYNIPSGIYIPPRVNNSENSNQEFQQFPHLYQVYFPVLVPNNNGERLRRMPRNNAFQYLHSLPVHNDEIFRQAGNFRFNPIRLPQIFNRRFRTNTAPTINMQNHVPSSTIDNASGDNATRNGTHNADQYDYNARITNDARNIFSLHQSLSANLNPAEGPGPTNNNLTPMTFSPFLRGSAGAGEGANNTLPNRQRNASAPRYTHRPLLMQVMQQRNLRVMRRELRIARRRLLHAYHHINSSAPENATLRSLLQDALLHVQAAQLPNFISLIRLMTQNRRN